MQAQASFSSPACPGGHIQLSPRKDNNSENAGGCHVVTRLLLVSCMWLSKPLCAALQGEVSA